MKYLNISKHGHLQIKIVGWVRAIWNKRLKTYDSSLHISDNFNWTEENLQNTILHEMIHLYIKDYMIPMNFWKRLFSKEHNKDFINMMNELNEKYGLNIVIKAKHMKKERKY